MTKINKQQLEPFKLIEEWIEEWGAGLEEIAKVKLRVAVVVAIGKIVVREKVECDRCCQCQKDLDVRGEGTD